MRRWITGLSSTLTFTVAAALLGTQASAQAARALDLSLSHFNADRLVHGLADPSAELRPVRSQSDERGVAHVRFNQVYRGVPVFEGEAITHVDVDGDVTVTDSLRSNLRVSPEARVGRGAAISTALGFINPAGDYQVREASLWISPRGERSLIDRLVWQVVVAVENDFDDPAEWRYFVDANSGAVAWAYDNLKTSDVPVTAKTMYMGDQTVQGDRVWPSYYLRNVLFENGSYTCDMGGRTSGSCTTFSRTTAVFGDNSKSNTNAAAAGADAHFGLQATWNYYRTPFYATASTAAADGPTPGCTTARTTRTRSGATPVSA